MVVDDIVVVGARPLLMTDYIAYGHVVPERIRSFLSPPRGPHRTVTHSSGQEG